MIELVKVNVTKHCNWNDGVTITPYPPGIHDVSHEQAASPYFRAHCEPLDVSVGVVVPAVEKMTDLARHLLAEQFAEKQPKAEVPEMVRRGRKPKAE